MAGFSKTGAYLLNPGEISDCELAPSKVLAQPKVPSGEVPPKTPSNSDSTTSNSFSQEEEILYKNDMMKVMIFWIHINNSGYQLTTQLIKLILL